MEYYSAINKNEIMPFAAMWMNLEMIILKQRKTDILCYHLYLESRTVVQVRLFMKEMESQM